MDARKRKIVVAFPTRQRVNYCLDTINSFENNAEDKNRVEYGLYVDSDDPEIEGYKLIEKQFEGRVTLFVNEDMNILGKSICNKDNKLADWALRTHGADLMINAADKHQALTKGWDTAVDKFLAAQSDPYWAIYWDNPKREGWYNGVTLTREYWAAQGWFYPPDFIHFYCDQITIEVSKEIGRAKIIEDQAVSDLNPKYGFAKTGRVPDATHKAQRTPDIIQHDKTRYNLFGQEFKNGAIGRLKEAIEKYRANHPTDIKS